MTTINKKPNEKIDAAMVRCLASRGIDERSIQGYDERQAAQSCPDLIRHCLEWLCDCQWADFDECDLRELPAAIILKAVRVHYHGGLGQFISDAKA